ncbi:MAG: BREX-1 system adenine-specific DNA-methyltransferase PglX, partial [Lachnospiraceae bacterium]|nr:BREX-1 system adenine-specific DNA-methyltransferase PglX [Lachnospiraceae bacterium]
GRVWIEHLRAVDASVDEKAKAEEFGWKYYLPEAEQEADVASQLIEIRKNYRELTPQDITCIDPCMGSGHILVYMFDVLMDIYRSEGFSEREAVFDILEKNIRGLDIDRRAYQLSYFALMMKARGYNRIFFRGKENIDGERVQAEPQVYAVEESNNVNKNQLKYFGEGLSEIEINDALNQLNGLLSQLVDAKEYGSILILEKYNWELLLKFVDNYSIPGQMDFEMIGIEANQKLLRRLIRIGKIIEMKYDAVVTNPPYMNLGDSSVKLNEYTKKHYPDTKSDLYAVFIEKCMEMASETGFVSMITQQTWMFLGAFEKLRIKILKKRISTFLQLGPRSFDDIGGEVVQSASFVINNAYVPSYKARYFKLTEEGSSEDKKNSFLKGEHEHIALQDNFNNVPSSEFAFWLSEEMFSLFANSRLSDKAQIKSGMSTSDNNRFLRVWFEVERGKIGLSTERIDDTEDGKYKWYPYNKGGSYRKWYGNIAYVVNWESNGKEIKYFVTHNPKDPNTTSWSRRIFNIEYSMRESLSWSKVSSGMFALRYYPQGFMFDVAGPGIFIDDENRLYVMGLLNSKLSVPLIKELYPTLNYETGQIVAFPILIDYNENNIVNENVSKCIELARDDWNL